MDITTILFYKDDDKVPYKITLKMPPEDVCLRDFKRTFNDANAYKFFFQTINDLGKIKTEFTDESTPLPSSNGTVVSWILSAPKPALTDNVASSNTIRQSKIKKLILESKIWTCPM